jgi:membrane protein implicated in regulation of membrane protease activity
MQLAVINGWSLDLAYLVCLLLGLFYGAFAGLLTLIGGHDGGVGHGDHVIGHTGSEVDQMGHEPGTADSGIHMSPWSPIVVTIFLVSFGGSGLSAMQLFGWGMGSLGVAAPSGFVMAGLTFAAFNKIFRMSQGSSEPSIQEIVGKEAEVITPIPENALGEIAYNRRGSRFTAPARSESGGAIAKSASVTITRVVGNTYYVSITAPTKAS